MCLKSCVQGVPSQLPDLTGDLDAGRATPDDDEGQLGLALGLARCRLGAFEGAEHARAHRDRALQGLDLARYSRQSSWPKYV